MYKFLHTERTNEKASEFETKSLLYLLSMREDSIEIDKFIIDCFNDVTGGDISCNKLWDVQSKGIKTLNPKKIGKSLITLFENFLSNIEFSFYLLFFPKVKDNYLVDSTMGLFDINNFQNNYKEKIKEGLKEEYSNKNGLDAIDEGQIENFISVVNFVVAEENKCNYIKNVIKFNNKISKDDNFFNNIFDEIRDKQSALKNISIHNREIEKVQEVLKFNKYMKKSEIEMLIINRLIGIDIFKMNSIPISFYSEIKMLKIDEEEIRDIIQECNSNISLMLFNNNNKKYFWEFFESVYTLIRKFPNDTINEIYERIPQEKIKNVKVLNKLNVKFFISLLKEGIISENN